MKKKLFTLLFALVAIATTAQAQVVLNAENFHDANFRAALAEILGISEGDEITETKIAATTSINVSYKKITGLTGIEYFTALTSLNCRNNQLTALDVSKNTALTDLDCRNNQLTSLDLSNQPNLTIRLLVSGQFSKKKAVKLADGRIGLDLGVENLDVSRITELKANDKEMEAAVSGQYLIIAENAESWPKKVTYKYDTKYPTEVTTMDVEINTAAVTLTENQVWWGYFKESDDHRPNILFCDEETTMNAAIFIPANHEIVGGNTIKAIRVWLGRHILDETSTWSPMTLWISTTLPSDISDADYAQTIPNSLMAPGLNEYELTTPFVVNNAGIYVGFSFSWKGNTNTICLEVLEGNDNPDLNSFFYRTSYDSDWNDISEYGCLALQVLLEGGLSSLNNNAATPSNFKMACVEKGKSVSIPVQITNKGKNPIKSISYTITTNGNTMEETTISLNNLAYEASEDVSIKFPADIDVGKKFLKTLTITKVNGEENGSSEKTATGNLITVSEKPVVVPVVEEFTGTWCGWCPIGIEGMKETHEAFGDKVALIALHNDGMYIDDYKPIFKFTNSFPNSIINRETEAYPWGSTLKRYCEDEMKNKVTVAEIQATATWKDRGKTAIQIDTNTKFVYTDDDGQYGIAYVLVEDGLTGWSQNNFISNNSDFAGYPSLAFWINSPEVVSGIEFNHVAVAAWDVEYGVDGSINPYIKEGESQTYTFEANIADKKLIQDKSKLKVITLLIDRSTGRIINAAQTMIQEDETGIDNMNSFDSQIVGRYGLDGRRITTPQRGLNIVKMSDGSVKKVMVK